MGGNRSRDGGAVLAGRRRSQGMAGGPIPAVRGGSRGAALQGKSGERSTWAGSARGHRRGRCLQAGATCCVPVREPLGAPAETTAGRRPALVSYCEIGVNEAATRSRRLLSPARTSTRLHLASTRPPQLRAQPDVRSRPATVVGGTRSGGVGGSPVQHPRQLPYAVGAARLYRRHPIFLARPNGPSSAVSLPRRLVASGELWKTGQLRPGDRHDSFVPGRKADARASQPRAVPDTCWYRGETATTASLSGRGGN